MRERVPGMAVSYWLGEASPIGDDAPSLGNSGALFGEGVICGTGATTTQSAALAARTTGDQWGQPPFIEL